MQNIEYFVIEFYLKNQKPDMFFCWSASLHRKHIKEER